MLKSTKFIPRPGAVRFPNPGGGWAGANPHDPMFSTITMAATQVWAPKTGWTEILDCPNKGTVEYAEWLADKLHYTNDYGKEAAALLVAQAKELEELKKDHPLYRIAEAWMLEVKAGDRLRVKAYWNRTSSDKMPHPVPVVSIYRGPGSQSGIQYTVQREDGTTIKLDAAWFKEPKRAGV